MDVLPETSPDANILGKGGLVLSSIGRRWHPEDGISSLTWNPNYLYTHRESNPGPHDYKAAKVTTNPQVRLYYMEDYQKQCYSVLLTPGVAAGLARSLSLCVVTG